MNSSCSSQRPRNSATWFPVVAASLAVIVACSSGDDGAGVATTTASTTVAPSTTPATSTTRVPTTVATTVPVTVSREARAAAQQCMHVLVDWEYGSTAYRAYGYAGVDEIVAACQPAVDALRLDGTTVAAEAEDQLAIVVDIIGHAGETTVDPAAVEAAADRARALLDI